MLYRQRGASGIIELSAEPSTSLHRPSVDVMFQSIADTCTRQVLAMILTGMGSDGTKGMVALKAKGAHTLAEAEESCIVYGMPRAAFERALALDPGLAGIRYDLALVALRQGNLSVAITQAQATLAINPSHAGAHNVLGLALARSGRPEEASVQFGEALRADPASVEAHLNLGNLNARAGRPDQAIAEYRKALAIDPSYEPARRNLVSLLRYLGRDDEARRELKGGGKP